MPTAIELNVQRNQTWARMKEIADRAEAEGRDLTAEEQNHWDTASGEITSLDSRIERQRLLEKTPASPSEERRIPGREGPSGDRMADIQAVAAEYRQAFDRYLIGGLLEMEPQERRTLRRGLTTLSAEEQRALGVGNSVSAGYLVPPEFEAGIIQNMLAFGGMREAATVRSTATGADMPFTTSDDTGNVGELLAEHAAASEQDVTVGQRILKAFMYSSKAVRVSFQLLQDSAEDIEPWLSGLLAERIARITNTHFTTGVGPNQPSGIVYDAATGVSGVTGQATSVTWDNLISLEHSVDPAYRNRPGVRYMFHDNTLLYLRQVKDGEGRYIFQPGTTVGAPSTINGYPYTINQDVSTMQANAISILFGDLKSYRIRDVRGFFLLRLEELYALNGQVAFIGFSRHDGALIHAGTNPVKTFVNSAS